MKLPIIVTIAAWSIVGVGVAYLSAGVGAVVTEDRIIAECLSDAPVTYIAGRKFFCSDYEAMQAFLRSISRPGTSA